MGKNNPIGLFDSGVGGLTVAHALQTLMPSENLKVAYADPGQGSIQNFDIGLLYAYYNSGDTVYQVSLLNQEITARYPVAFLPVGVELLDDTGNVLVMSRTYNIPGAKVGGTFGQALEGIPAARTQSPTTPHVAVFDTAFHAAMPPRAFHYALPYVLYKRHRIRRYGNFPRS